MSSEHTHEVTQLLHAMMQGEKGALDRLMPLVQEELKGIAGRLLQREAPGYKAEPSVIVHATYLHLLDSGLDTAVANRRSFYRVAARIMRQILVERARARAAGDDGSADWRQEPFEPLLHYFDDQGIDFLNLDEELKRIGQVNPRWDDVMTMRLFGGLTTQEIADELSVPERTVQDDWRFAMAVLHQRLH
jgi:RNA polymerase sigma factor (TIGR02999 family)